MRDLGARFRKGAAWVYIQGWAVTAISFAGGVAMARLLDPVDFGVFAAVTAFTSVLAHQLQLGVPEALLRTPEDDGLVLDSAFWTMQGLALACFAVAWLAAPLLAQAYDDPRFVTLMRLLAAVFLVQPAAYAAMAHMRRAMRHDRAARVAVVSSLMGVASGVAAAAMGAGAFAFAVGGATSGVAMSIMAVWRSRWRPRIRFDRDKARAVLGYGLKIHVGNTLSVAADKVDTMLVGSGAGTVTLGFYNRAVATARMPVRELLGRLYAVILPAFGRLEGAGERSRRAYRKVTTVVGASVLLALSWLWLSAEPFITLLYGEKWVPAVPAIRILVIAAAIGTFRGLLGMYASAVGLAGRRAWLEGVGLVVTALAVLVGLRGGLEGVAWGIVFRNAVMLVLMLELARRHTAVGPLDVWAGAWPGIVASGAAAAVGCAFPDGVAAPGWQGDLMALGRNAAVTVVVGVAALAAIRAVARTHEGVQALFELTRLGASRMRRLVRSAA